MKNLTTFSYFLIDEAFCGNPDLGLSEEQVAGCQNFISAFMPPALQSLFGFLQNNVAEACTVVYDGIC